MNDNGEKPSRGLGGDNLYGDEEEFAYSGYSDATYEMIAKKRGEYSDNADIYVTDTAAEEEESAVQEKKVFLSDGDFIVEDFAPASNAKSVSRLTKAPEKAVRYFMASIYIVLGAVCASMSNIIEGVLPYVVGISLAVFAVIRLVLAIAEKEYKSTTSNKTVSSLILIGLSIMILIEREWAHTFIPTAWGVWGLVEGAEAFNHALSRITRHKNCVYYIVKGVTEVVIAFLLIYKPDRYGELHIIIFGISLILDGIVLLPFVHKIVTKK